MLVSAVGMTIRHAWGAEGGALPDKTHQTAEMVIGMHKGKMGEEETT